MRVKATHFLFVSYLVIGWANIGLGQVTAFLDDDFFFVLNGQGEEISGVDIQSPLGGLVPAENQNAAPFTFMLSNTPQQVTYGHLGTTTTVDGNLKLTAGYNPNIGDPSTKVYIGDGPVPVEVPLTIGACEGCPPSLLRATVNEDLNFVLTGRDHQVSDITFRSPSGSLVPATSPAPFTETAVNTTNQISFSSNGPPVTLDGEVVLAAGWSDHLFTRDVEYEYTVLHDDTSLSVGPKTLRSTDYEYSLPRLSRLDTFVNNADHIVFRGSGQPLTSLTISAFQNSLIPSDDPGPFDSILTNTAGEVTYGFDSPVQIDGEVVLPVKWDWEKPKNIHIAYDQVGELPRQVYTIPQFKFPVVPESGREPLLITLDENNNFVITGIGQDVLGIEFSSPSGALRPSEQTELAPFPLTLSNDSENIALGVLGSVKIDGSFVMDFGPSDPSLLDEITINVGFGARPTPNPPNIECDRCDYPAILLDQNRGFILDDVPDPVTELKFSSKFGGFEILESVPDGLTLISSTENELIVGSETGLSGASLDGLQAVWGSSFDSAVFVNFTFVDGTSFGPLPLELSSPAVPEPTSGMLLSFAFLGLMAGRHSRKR